MAGRTRWMVFALATLIVGLIPTTALAQTGTYYLHRELLIPGVRESETLKTIPPDAPVTILQSADLNGMDRGTAAALDHFETLPLNRQMAMGGTAFTFNVRLRKTANVSGIAVNASAGWVHSHTGNGNPTGGYWCGVVTPTELTTTFTSYTLSCQAPTDTQYLYSHYGVTANFTILINSRVRQSVRVEMSIEDGSNVNGLPLPALPPPSISSISPSTGSINSAVTIDGQNFGGVQGAVTFNGVTATPLAWSDTRIFVRVPVGATTGAVIVSNADGQLSNSVPFTVGSLVDPGGELSFYSTDAVGSVRLITNAAGQEVTRYDYLPFGQDWGTGQAGDPNTVKFAGKERDRETGAESLGWTPLDYFGARYYQAQTGRFTSVDPVVSWEEAIVDPQQWNRFVYVRNNPFRHTDPDGRSIKLAITAFKVGQALYKGYDVYTSVEGIVTAAKTIVSPDSTGKERALAVVALAGELSGVTDAVKAGKAAVHAVDNLADGSRLVRNPFGQAGKADHVATVERLKDKARQEFPNDAIFENTTIRKAPNSGGTNVRPDVWVQDSVTGEVKKAYEAARKDKGKNADFVKRERKKRQRYEDLGIDHYFEEVVP